MNEYALKRKELEQRTIDFSVGVIKTLAKHSKTFELRPIIDQIIRSSASIGANYAEANNASSKADFKNKIFIAKKEVAETRYWLKILTCLISDNLDALEQEAKELNLILQKIISTMRSSESNGK